MMLAAVGPGAHVVPARGSAKRLIAVWDLVQWAFRSECAQLDFDEIGSEMGARVGVGVEYRLLEQHRLGCRPDGGGTSEPHHDAGIVASALSALDESVGGRSMAISIAELARAGQVPDWMPDARPKVVPVDLHTNRHGRLAKTADSADLGCEGWPPQARRNRKGVIVRDAVKYTPVVIRPSPAQIARAHRAYLAWWGAVLELGCVLRSRFDLTSFELTQEMPPLEPWKKRLTKV